MTQKKTIQEETPEKTATAPAYSKERAKEVFDTHSVDEIYFTSDGTCFIEEQHALAHAGNLINGTVTPVKRQEA